MVSPQIQPYENPASVLFSPEDDIQRTTKRKNKILFVKNIQKSNNTEARRLKEKDQEGHQVHQIKFLEDLLVLREGNQVDQEDQLVRVKENRVDQRVLR